MDLKIRNFYDEYNLNIWKPVVWKKISTFATETVSVLWLYKIMSFQEYRSFPNRYLYNQYLIAEYCVLST